ncbi:MAG: bifunctional non-ous end joining protein LigD [Solirubrobacteraceae bacterium]|nr:bifunctional non-ous end joining protein LigD [Solirubrobacteraceae bacterium]
MRPSLQRAPGPASFSWMPPGARFEATVEPTLFRARCTESLLAGGLSRVRGRVSSTPCQAPLPPLAPPPRRGGSSRRGSWSRCSLRRACPGRRRLGGRSQVGRHARAGPLRRPRALRTFATGTGLLGGFPELAGLTSALARRRVVLDGELVCLAADGKPDFVALRRRLVAGGRDAARRAAARGPRVTLMVRRASSRRPSASCRTRRAGSCSPSWSSTGRRGARRRTSSGRPEKLAAVTAEQGLKGIVAKRLDTPWVAGRRSASWVKTKHRRREDLLITGWRERRDEPEEFFLARRGADGALTPAGSVTFGWTVRSAPNSLKSSPPVSSRVGARTGALDGGGRRRDSRVPRAPGWARARRRSSRTCALTPSPRIAHGNSRTARRPLPAARRSSRARPGSRVARHRGMTAS